MSTVRMALAQVNMTVGALPRNVQKILENIEKARQSDANLIVFPELAICGYPPEDLLLKPAFIHACREDLEEVIRASHDLVCIIGFPEEHQGKLYNAAAVISNGKLIATYRKQLLPNYGVFDERRYFTPGTENPVFNAGALRFGVSICEDIWDEQGPPVAQAQKGGAQILINISASPYHRGKQRLREAMLSKRARDTQATVAYLNLVGGQDELVFDGASAVFDTNGKLIARAKQFEEDLLFADVQPLKSSSGAPPQVTIPVNHKAEHRIIAAKVEPLLRDLEEVYEALVLGTRDYLQKNGFKKVVIGLSGGIDSALVAAVAVDSLGADNVTGVALPSQYSSEHSKSDAAQLAKNLGIRFLTIPIEPIYAAFEKALQPIFAGTKPDITEENLQSRIRGMLLMALSNKFGWLVLTTGNKSEVSVGYATLYGDMAGGFAVIKDVPKMLVYDLCRHRNTKSAVIPENTFTKPPSAELRPDQKDTDSLPEYPVLDAILHDYVEQNASFQEIAAKGFAPEIVKKVMRLVDRAEYKRRQGAPGIKITERGLGKDWRLPLTHHFVEVPKEIITPVRKS